MKSFTNHQPGARGINIKGGGTTWIEPGQTVEIDEDTIEGALPDFGKPADNADQLDAANAKLKPYLVKDAVAGLDHGNDAHWTKGGEPAVDAVAAVVGSGVTRAEIVDVAPDAKRNA